MTTERRFNVYYRRKNKDIGDLVTPQPIQAKSKDQAVREVKRCHPQYTRSRLMAVEVTKTLETPVVVPPPQVFLGVGETVKLGDVEGVVE